MILFSTLSIGQVSDLQQQLVLASELASDLLDTKHSGNRLLDFNAGKFQLILLDIPRNFEVIYVKMDGSVIEVELSFKMLGLSFSFKTNTGSVS